MKKKILGVLGGMGPAAGARLISLITEFTAAEQEQEHIEIMLHSLPSIPDRTDFILGKSPRSPLPKMKSAILALFEAGAEIIAVPCNTAEYFHSELQAQCPVPILRTAYESAKFAASRRVKKLGIIATEGTVYSEIYQNHLRLLGVDFCIPEKTMQSEITSLIYSGIKKSLPVETDILQSFENELRKKGCDAAVLGCTELSLLPLKDKGFFIDSLSVLAAVCVNACGYTLNDKGRIFT
jgi:aspartate racemase